MQIQNLVGDFHTLQLVYEGTRLSSLPSLAYQFVIAQFLLHHEVVEITLQPVDEEGE